MSECVITDAVLSRLFSITSSVLQETCANHICRKRPHVYPRIPTFSYWRRLLLLLSPHVGLDIDSNKRVATNCVVKSIHLLGLFPL